MSTTTGTEASAATRETELTASWTGTRQKTRQKNIMQIIIIATWSTEYYYQPTIHDVQVKVHCHGAGTIT